MIYDSKSKCPKCSGSKHAVTVRNDGFTIVCECGYKQIMTAKEPPLKPRTYRRADKCRVCGHKLEPGKYNRTEDMMRRACLNCERTEFAICHDSKGKSKVAALALMIFAPLGIPLMIFLVLMLWGCTNG